MFSQSLTLTLALVLCYTLISPYFNEISMAEACSSRSVPKPRPSNTVSSSSIATKMLPPSSTTTAPLPPTTMAPTTTTTTTTARPNITFPTYKCPATYDAWYCLNEATCFSVKIGDSVMYNCECAIGFMGPRCEYKELDGSYLPKRPRPMLEKASIASGATLALLFMLFVCLTLYLRYDQKTTKFASSSVDDMTGFKSSSSSTTSRCCYCSEKCCNDVSGGGGGGGINDVDNNVADDDDDNANGKFSSEKWWRRRFVAGVGALTGGGGGGAAGFARRQANFEAMPMTYAVKRTAKM